MAKGPKKKKTAASEISAKAIGTWTGSDWLWSLLLLGLVLLAYQPIGSARFIWDDDLMLTGNPCIIGPLGLKEIWTTSAADICPFALTTFWTEHALWGLWPLPYHLVNVLLHGANALVLWRVLRSLRIPGAWFGAALWALHPVEVESVAWIAEMKNTESGLFFLLSIFFFIKGHGGRGGWNYAFTLLFAFLAMASKSSTVILPVALCLSAWWMDRRCQWRNLLVTAPVFLMSVAASFLAIWTQKVNGADVQLARSVPERVIEAGAAIWFYLGKLIWPHPLLMVYPPWKMDSGDWLSYLPLLALVVVLAFAWLKRESWARPVFFILAYFIAALSPILGLVNNTYFTFTLVADHFQYLASMGPLALAGAVLARSADSLLPGKLRLQAVLGATLLLALGFITWQRVWVYQDERTLWTNELTKNPGCWVAYNNLGLVAFHEGQPDKAMELYLKALAIQPNYGEAGDNLGIVLAQKGRVDEAMGYYVRILKLYPRFAKAHNNLGVIFVMKGQLPDGIAQFEEALRLQPDYVNARNNLAKAQRMLQQKAAPKPPPGH